MLLSLGSNGSGQLGLGHREDVDHPAVVSQAQITGAFTKITAGGNHTLLLSKDGNLFCSGELLDGDSGKEDLSETLSKNHSTLTPFKAVNSDTDLIWKLCAATWEASTLVTQESSLYSHGTGNKGELGLGEFVSEAFMPTLMPDFPPPALHIVDIAAGMNHTVAVLSDGSVWGWGSGRKGQLGQPPTVAWKPRKIECVSFTAVKAVCGREFTFIAGPSRTGECLILGSNKFQVQTGVPSSILGWRQIGATWGSAFVLMEDGQMRRWGRDDHGQLGPDDLPLLDAIATGSEHVLALSKAGEVLAWGWGEHGNCGAPTDGNGDVKGRYNILPAPSECRYIAAGCATSWFECDD